MNDTASPTAPAKISGAAVAALLAAACLVRAGAVSAKFDQLNDDPDGYRRIAENLRRCGVYSGQPALPGGGRPAKPAPTAFRPPLYPLALWAISCGGGVRPAAIAGLHIALGVATVGLVLLLARWWQLGRWGSLAAMLVACDPILLHQSTLVMTETLAAFLAVVGLVCLTRLDRCSTAWMAGAAGGSLALAALCRPTFLAWLVLVLAAEGCRSGSWRRRAKQVGAISLVALLVLAPWTIRNYRRFGRPIVGTTHGGYTLLWGNNPKYYQHLREAPWGAVWDAKELKTLAGSGRGKPVEQKGQSRRLLADEIQADRAAYAQALEAIRAEPAMFAYACLLRVGHLWRPLPLRTSAPEAASRRLLRYAAALWYVLLYLLAGLGILALRRTLFAPPWLWGTLLCLAFTAVHTVYWTDMRMRAPLMPFVCLLAAAGTRLVRPPAGKADG